jgi:hypothetical protein
MVVLLAAKKIVHDDSFAGWIRKLIREDALIFPLHPECIFLVMRNIEENQLPSGYWQTDENIEIWSSTHSLLLRGDGIWSVIIIDQSNLF